MREYAGRLTGAHARRACGVTTFDMSTCCSFLAKKIGGVRRGGPL